MCAAIRLSLVSVVCEPVTSTLLIVAVKVIFVGAVAESKRKRAVPFEAGRAPPVEVVGTVGGTSWLLVSVVVNNLTFGGSMPAVVNKESTYAVLVRLLNLLMNSGRFTK